MADLPDHFVNSPYHVFNGRFWAAVVTNNQSYLGRCTVYLLRPLKDVLEVTKEERDELWDEILPGLAKAMTKAFDATRINYGHLANQTLHVHWHVVPRYENPATRKFASEVFTDERVGHNWAPNADKKLAPNMMKQIQAELMKFLDA